MTPSEESLSEARHIYGSHALLCSFNIGHDCDCTMRNIALALDRAKIAARLEGKKDGLELAIDVCEIHLSRIGLKGLVKPIIRAEITKLGEK